jgi:hypothetical protein
MPDTGRTASLVDLARRYADGGLSGADADAFERRLASDPDAQDALCAAVRQSGGRTAPDPAYRAAVHRRLLPSWWRRLFAPRPHRGHPVFWAAVGAAAALLVVLLLPHGPAPSDEAAAPVGLSVPREVAREEAPAPRPTQRLARALEEENRRKGRAEERRVAREDRVIRPMGQPVELP